MSTRRLVMINDNDPGAEFFRNSELCTYLCISTLRKYVDVKRTQQRVTIVSSSEESVRADSFRILEGGYLEDVDHLVEQDLRKWFSRQYEAGRRYVWMELS